ncbi:MAG TPA: hypothetical protein VHG33_04990, partial [Woeseiaceae bacterium]|nr:hypothetical protein [Woeseiaceae bacterium]
NAAREDNPEEVFAAWQRALAQKGLTAGRFYRIYDPAAAAPIEDEHLQRRFEAKRREDMDAILHRIDELEVERSYRIVGELEQIAKNIREFFVPRLREARASWRRRVFWHDAVAFGTVLLLLLGVSIAFGWWDGMRYAPPWLDTLTDSPVLLWSIVALAVLAALLLHGAMRRLAGRAVLRQIRSDESLGEHAGTVARAFEANIRSLWPFFLTKPRGWGMWTRRKLDAVLSDAHRAIRDLNDRYTDPSGRSSVRERPPEDAARPAAEAEAEGAEAEQPVQARWRESLTAEAESQRQRTH